MLQQLIWITARAVDQELLKMQYSLSVTESICQSYTFILSLTGSSIFAVNTAIWLKTQILRMQIWVFQLWVSSNKQYKEWRNSEFWQLTTLLCRWCWSSCLSQTIQWERSASHTNPVINCDIISSTQLRV